MSYELVGGYYPVEIMGDDVGDEYAGDIYAGDIYAGDEGVVFGDEFAGDEYAGDEFSFVGMPPAFVGAPFRRSPIRRGPTRANLAGRPMMRQQARPMMRPAAPRPQPSPLGKALADRRAMAGALLDTRGATKAREYPLGFASTTPVIAGGSQRITTRPQVPFRVDRLVVPSDIAGLFVIDDVKVGKNSQFAAEGAVPARVFQENGVGVTLKGDTAQVSMDVTLSVSNVSGAPSVFRAAIIGPAVE